MLLTKESLAEKFIKKSFWLYIPTLIIGPLGYLIKVIISRDLSVEEVGMIYGVISFVTLLSIYNDLGFTESLLYFLPKQLVENEYGRAKYLIYLAFITQLTTSILIFCILYFFAPWLATHYFQAPEAVTILRIAGLFFIGINLLHIATTFFISIQDVKLQKITELIRIGGTFLGALILFTTEEGNLERYMIIWILGLFFSIIFAVFFFFRRYYIPHFFYIEKVRDITLRKTFFKYAVGTLLTANIGMVLSQVDMQLIIYFLGPKEAGFYSTYLSLIGIPFLLISPVISFLFPVISELSGRKEKGEIQTLVRRFWSYFGIIGIWMGFFLFQFGEVLSVLLFSEKFRASGEILIYSAPFLFLNILSQIVFQLLAGTGQIRKRIEILFYVLLMNVPLNLLLIPIYGSKGSALAVGLSWILLYILSIRAVPDMKIPILGEKSWYINIFAGGIAFVGAFLFMKNYAELPIFSEIILAILLYLSIFLLTNRKLILEALGTIKRVLREKKESPITETSLPL